MTDPEAGVPLTGGNSNAPVRYGDRVHRIAGPWSPTVHALLRHLRASGIEGVPEPFGFDGSGREVLAYLPGYVPVYPLPDAVWADAFLRDAARLLRRLHDASNTFDRVGRIWQQPSRTPDEVISLNDFAPYNLVLDGDAIVGVIDLDQASPGPRTRDLAHVAYRLVPLMTPTSPAAREFGAPELRRRLRVLLEAYGDVTADEVLAAVPDFLADMAAHAESHGMPGHAPLYRADAVWLSGIAPYLAAQADQPDPDGVPPAG